TVQGLRARLAGEIQVGGPEMAQSLSDLGLIDEYRLYLHPVVLGSGKPFFAGPRPPLRLVACDRIGGQAIKLTYFPACTPSPADGPRPSKPPRSGSTRPGASGRRRR